MFKKLVSNLPFSPSLVGQLGFYAKRLKKEESLRRLGLIFTVFALIIQSFAVFSPPESANASTGNDMCPGVTWDVAGANKIKACYNNNSNYYRDIMNFFGISKSELWSALDAGGSWRYTTTYGEWYTFGHNSRSIDVKNYSDQVPGDLYARKWKNTITTRQWGWQGNSGSTGFIVLADCGNLALDRLPPPPPPPPPPAPTPVYTCDLLTQQLISRDTFKFTATANGRNGAALKDYVYNYGDGKSETTTNSVAQHQYTAPGTYDTSVTARFTVNGSVVNATSPACKTTVTVNPPTVKTPHVSIIKTVGPNHQETLEVAKDGTFIYTITVTNDGEVDLKNVVVSDPAKEGIQFLSAKAGTTNVPVTGNKIDYTIPTLVQKQSVTIVITAKSTAVATTPVVNKVCVETPTIPGTNPDACDTASTTTPQPPVKTPHVSIAKTVGDDKETLQVAKDGTFVYTVVVKNDGEVDLKNAEISDTAPKGISFVSADKGKIAHPIAAGQDVFSYTIPTLAVGKSEAIKITARSTAATTTPAVNKVCVETPTIPGTNPDACDTAGTTTPAPGKVNVCDAKTGKIIEVDEPDASKYEPVDSEKCRPTCTTNPTMEGCTPDIRMIKTANNKGQGDKDATTVTANGGDVITYNITLTNNGKTSGKITLDDVLVDTLEYATLTDLGGATYNESTKTLSWGEITVEAGATITRTFAVTVNNPVPSMAQNHGSPDSYDCVMSNVVRKDGEGMISIPVNCPAVKTIVEQTIVKQLPATGPGENIMFGGIVAAVVVFFYARSRQLGKEVRLVRREFNVGTL